MALRIYQSLWATEMRRPGVPERPVEERFDRVRAAGTEPGAAASPGAGVPDAAGWSGSTAENQGSKLTRLTAVCG